MKRILTLAVMIISIITTYAFRTDTLTIKTDLLPEDMNVTVIVPDSNADATFPTVYLLNGYTGDHRAWGNVRKDLGDIADRLGFVIVMPNGMDSWYFDSPIDPKMQMETFITKTLVPYIDKNYPTIPDRSKRAISGLSMGGHGAFWLASRHPDIWGSAGSTSGGLDFRPFSNRWKIALRLGEYDSNIDVWNSHTIATQVEALKNANLNLIFDCGVDDFFAQVNSDFHNALVEAKVPHDYTSRPGNHSQKYWANSILYHLLFFDQAFKK